MWSKKISNLVSKTYIDVKGTIEVQNPAGQAE